MPDAAKEREGRAGQGGPHVRGGPGGGRGKNASIYGADDPRWKEAAKAEDPDKFM